MGFLRRGFFVFFLFVPAAAGAVTPEMDRHLQDALDAVYTMRFADAEAAVRGAMAVDEAHPYGPLGLAVVSMIQYLYGSEQADPGLLGLFSKRVDQAVSSGERWVKKHPGDPEGFLALGAAYGLSARLLAVRHQWVRAFWRGREAIAYLSKAAALKPDLDDVALGLGMYDYYTDTYPRFVRVLAKLVLRGNRQRGISELRRAARGGRYSQVVAKLIMTEICLEDAYGLRDPAEGLKLITEVRQRYPESAMIFAIELNARYEAGRYAELLAGVETFNERVQRGEYDSVQLAKGLVIKGTALWAMKRPGEALEPLRAAAEMKVAGRATRWSVWARIREAQLLDFLGQRQAALTLYQEAMAEPDLWDLRHYAKAGLRGAWTQVYPGPIAPF